MTNEVIKTNEVVSALVDGQLCGAEFAQAMAHLENNSEARLTWHSYHVVGEVLRSGQAGASAHDANFMQRFQERLARDVASLRLENANKMIASDALPEGARGKNSGHFVSANDSVWRLVVGLASVAVVAVFAWQGFLGQGSSDQPLTASIVAQPTAPLAADTQLTATTMSTAKGKITAEADLVMIRDPQLDALLAAHRQFGGSSALPTPSGFLRNATFEEGVR